MSRERTNGIRSVRNLYDPRIIYRRLTYLGLPSCIKITELFRKNMINVYLHETTKNF